jgi:Mg/Co/Ni transporter MgtE
LLWKDLWSFSIVISALTHLQIFLEDADASRSKLIKHFSDFPIDEVFRDRLIEDMISVSKLAPSHYLSHLIGSYTEGELQKLRKSMRIIDDLSARYITNAVDVFIDAFDQSLQETFTGNLGDLAL